MTCCTVMKRALILVFGLGVAGCGSDNNGASCGEASACGGDVTGKWKITSSCLNGAVNPANMDCPGITTDVKGLSNAGNITFNADKTYQSSVTISGSLQMKVPASCLKQQSVTLTCAQLQQSLEADADSGFASVSCTGSTDCSCSIALEPTTTEETGTYSTSGGTLAQTADGGTSEETDYCVKGKTLTVSISGGDADGTTGTVALAKQ